MKALDNRFYVKFMQLEIGLLNSSARWFQYVKESNLFDCQEQLSTRIKLARLPEDD